MNKYKEVSPYHHMAFFLFFFKAEERHGNLRFRTSSKIPETYDLDYGILLVVD